MQEVQHNAMSAFEATMEDSMDEQVAVRRGAALTALGGKSAGGKYTGLIGMAEHAQAQGGAFRRRRHTDMVELIK